MRIRYEYRKELLIKYNGELVLDENDDVNMNGKNKLPVRNETNKKMYWTGTKNCYQMCSLKYVLPKDVSSNLTYYLKPFYNNIFNKPRVARLRSIGSNGDREMAHCFMEVGFEV